MDYFTEAERQAILEEEREFDRNLIHEKYKNRVIAAEKVLTSRTLQGKGEFILSVTKLTWIDFFYFES